MRAWRRWRLFMRSSERGTDATSFISWNCRLISNCVGSWPKSVGAEFTPHAPYIKFCSNNTVFLTSINSGVTKWYFERYDSLYRQWPRSITTSLIFFKPPWRKRTMFRKIAHFCNFFFYPHVFVFMRPYPELNLHLPACWLASWRRSSLVQWNLHHTISEHPILSRLISLV
jgi:hypothetical protein